jgi:ribosomal-protein-alanine N-acetyltransferase
MNLHNPLPILSTPQLYLRSFTLADAPAVQAHCSDYSIYATTLQMPKPYTLADAEWWINSHSENIKNNSQVNYALIEPKSQLLVGTVGLTISNKNNNAEMGYWIGKAHWNKGYATEGAMAVLQFGFETLQLHKIYAAYFDNNPTSGRVLQKIGLLYEGFSPEQIKKDGQYIGLFRYGLTRKQWHEQQQL